MMPNHSTASSSRPSWWGLVVVVWVVGVGEVVVVVVGGGVVHSRTQKRNDQENPGWGQQRVAKGGMGARGQYVVADS